MVVVVRRIGTGNREVGGLLRVSKWFKNIAV
jgi:hypothetical protein